MSVRLLALCALCLGATLACGGSQKPDDAGPEGPTFDRPVDQAVALHVDFTVTDCPHLEAMGDSLRCRGPVPLAVTYLPVTSPSVGTYLWDFGDGPGRASAQTPSHTYEKPGSYTVTLTVAGSSGSGERRREGFIVAETVPTGDPCDSDSHCADGETCLCSPATKGCPEAFARGLCSKPCPAECGPAAICADLLVSADGDAEANAQPWRKPLCLRRCEKTADCAPGMACRVLPSPAGAAEPWVKACFLPALPRDVGAPCRNEMGLLSNALCVTGVCTDLGALGTCSLDCASAACPDATGCARFGDGRTLCLRTCAGSAECAGDPLLGCETPGAAGPHGFTVLAGPAGGKYCAPRRCITDSECGPTGQCRPPMAGHCVRR